MTTDTLNTEAKLKIAGDLISAAGKLVPEFIDLVAAAKGPTLEERIKRAREALQAPADTSEEDAARRERLLRAVRGDR